MKSAWWWAWALGLVCGAALGQAAPALTNPFYGEGRAHLPFEIGAVGQGGFGVTDNRGGFSFAMAGVHAGKVLTGDLGRGPLRGSAEYAIEVFPYWESWTPRFQKVSCTNTAALLTSCSAPYTVGGTFHGATVTPIILRWNLAGTRRASFWGQAAGGLLWTNHKYPAYGTTSNLNVADAGPNADTSVWNFTPQGGVGMHVFVSPRRSVDVGANAVHISSASLGDRNPGVNASVQFTLGYTWWK